MQSYSVDIAGCRVLIIGARHTSIVSKRHNFDPRSHDVYKALESFSPTKLFVELEPHMTFETHARNTADIAALYAYTEDTGIPTVQYDAAPDKSFLEHTVNAPEELDEYETDSMEQDESRAILKREHPEMFWDMYANREDHAASQFVSALQAGERIAIHCGNNHFSVYQSLFEFLSLR